MFAEVLDFEAFRPKHPEDQELSSGGSLPCTPTAT